MDFLAYLRCPITKKELHWVEKEEFAKRGVSDGLAQLGVLTKGLIDQSGQYLYPVFEDIIVLHEHYALFVGTGKDVRLSLPFDKKRVFDYYNEMNYTLRDSFQVYEDSPKWVDYRPISSAYLHQTLARAAKFYPSRGKFLLDIASGPIGLPEYMALSKGYDYRVCVDLSLNALRQAKKNMQQARQQGIYICGDIANIPIRADTMDAVLSQHTLYHIPKEEQKKAVEELYRVAKPGSKIVVVYSWFYHSWLMNLSLHVVQLYRIARHLFGKVYARLFPKRPRLYFYAHDPSWFRQSFAFSNDIEFFSWRSVNKYFMKLYVHRCLLGESLLNKLSAWEEKHSKFMSTFGEYAAIVITKKIERN